MCVNDGSMLTNTNAGADHRTSEQMMVDIMRDDLGVTIDPQAWRMFLRYRWDRFSTLAHRIHEGKR